MSAEPVPDHLDVPADDGVGDHGAGGHDAGGGVMGVDPRTMDLKAKQEAYHDWESRSYEEKFSISYDQRCIDYARDRFRKVVPEGAGFGDVLEVGAGTGFFLINLALGGCLDGARLHASDLSTGMLDVCRRNGEDHGLDIATRQGDAESLPYDDASFDLVLGHAFLHHLPVPGAALREFARVLKPGGTLVVAGEPTELGERITGVVKQATYRTFRAVTSVPGLTSLRKPSRWESGGSERDAVLAGLEHEVDLHTFRPRDVARMAELAGLTEVDVVTEELTANWFGWAVRTIEGSVRPGVLGTRWAFGAYNGYLRLTALDERLLQRFVPDPLFYNLVLHARKPYGP
jgi:ubiquinone/menaquinone biosynthesis C-methylase UbiE